MELDEEYCTPSNGPYSHFAALNAISSWTVCNTHNKLQELYKVIRLHYLALKRLGVEDHAEGFTIKFLSKLSGPTSDRVSELMIQSGGKPIIPEMLEILRGELRVMELQEIAGGESGNHPDTEELSPAEQIHLEEEQKTQPGFSANSSLQKPSRSAFSEKTFSC